MTAEFGSLDQDADTDRALRGESSLRRRAEILESHLLPESTADSTDWVFRLAETADHSSNGCWRLPT